MQARRSGWGLAAVGALAASALSAAASASNPAPHTPSSGVEETAAATPEQKWGIQVSGLFLSAGGNLVDFRYRVLDPRKAATLTKPDQKPLLLDQTTGAKLQVPTGPKTGPMRQTTKQPVVGKTYFMLFANTRHHVKSGDKVTVVVGDFEAANLVVE